MLGRSYSLANAPPSLLQRAQQTSYPSPFTPTKGQTIHRRIPNTPTSPADVVTYGTPTPEERLREKRKQEMFQRREDFRKIKNQYSKELTDYQDKFNHLKELFQYINKMSTKYSYIQNIKLLPDNYTFYKGRIISFIINFDISLIQCQGIYKESNQSLTLLEACVGNLDVQRQSLHQFLTYLQPIYDKMEPYINQMNHFSYGSPNVRGIKRQRREFARQQEEEKKYGFLGKLYSNSNSNGNSNSNNLNLPNSPNAPLKRKRGVGKNRPNVENALLGERNVPHSPVAENNSGNRLIVRREPILAGEEEGRNVIGARRELIIGEGEAAGRVAVDDPTQPSTQLNPPAPEPNLAGAIHNGGKRKYKRKSKK